MKSYAILSVYYFNALGVVKFPQGKSWEDVDDWYVKWDNLCVRFKGDEAWIEIEIGSKETGQVDWKRPVCVEVLNVDQDGDPDYDKAVAEREG